MGGGLLVRGVMGWLRFLLDEDGAVMWKKERLLLGSKNTLCISKLLFFFNLWLHGMGMEMQMRERKENVV